MKKLSELIDTNLDIDIMGITDDSRLVSLGYLFVATKGFNVDHFDYIGDAIQKGCAFVVCDRKIDYDIPYLVVSDINDIYYKLCAKYYDISYDDYSFIGITGTDGKTTTTSIIKKLINNIRPCTYIGTNGAEIDEEKIDVHNTTPVVPELYNILNLAKANGSKDIVMEVSSEALLHERVKNIKYKVVGFTNITEDHLNIHKSLDNYIKSKLRLLEQVDEDGVVIVNGDDKICKDIVSNNVVRFGFDKSNDCIIDGVEKAKCKTKFKINYLGNTYKILSPYEGIYNIYNVTMAFLVCLHYGFAPEYLVDAISNLGVVAGRREKLDYGQDYEIILDYAHTYNGIKNVIESIPKNKNIIVVTGCAGGREREKRALIGKYILDNCNTAIFTMDDPRYEDVDEIINQMVSCSSKEYIRIINRKEAIYKALDLADNNSVVLILGKGRDNYMAIEDRKEEYSDVSVIESYFYK